MVCYSCRCQRFLNISSGVLVFVSSVVLIFLETPSYIRSQRYSPFCCIPFRQEPSWCVVRCGGGEVSYNLMIRSQSVTSLCPRVVNLSPRVVILRSAFSFLFSFKIETGRPKLGISIHLRWLDFGKSFLSVQAFAKEKRMLWNCFKMITFPLPLREDFSQIFTLSGALLGKTPKST